jgi:hypothetical protein
MARYLSPEWLEAARSPVLDKGTALVLEQVVLGGPDGTVVYRVHAGAGGAVIEWPVPDGAPAADLRITVDWETAVAVASGEMSSQRALMQGRLKLSGNPAGLADSVGALVGADALDPELRKSTTYPLPASGAGD